MHSKSDKIEILINRKPEEVQQELFQSLVSEYLIGFETSMGGIDFIFDCVHLLHYKCQKINFKRDSPD